VRPQPPEVVWVTDSRFQLQPLSAGPYGQREIYAGWDEVLQTYYGRVVDAVDEDGEDVCAVSVGTDVQSITDPRGVADALRSYAAIPADLEQRLASSRTDETVTIADLRPESPRLSHDDDLEQELQRLRLAELRADPGDESLERLSRLYKPGGFVTDLDRAGVAGLIADNGWVAEGLYAMDGGHAETFTRADQDLEIRWGWASEDHDQPRLLSPIRLDGHSYGVGSGHDLASLLAEGTPDRHTLTVGSEQRIDELLENILGAQPDDSSDLELNAQADNAEGGGYFGDPWSDDLGDDNGFHFGSGY
jgi:hypothetical protein